MSNRPIRVVILDFDGVVLESNQAKDDAFEELVAGYPEVRDAMRAHHLQHRSTPRRAKFEHFASKLLGVSDVESVVEEMGRRFSELVVGRVLAAAPVPGAIEFMADWSGRAPLYVASVTPHEELWRILRERGFDRYLEDAFGDPPYRKADAIRAILNREGVAPGEGVLIGDSPSDYHAATEVGVRFIGRRSGIGFGELDVLQCDDLHEANELLKEWMGSGG